MGGAVNNAPQEIQDQAHEITLQSPLVRCSLAESSLAKSSLAELSLT